MSMKTIYSVESLSIVDLEGVDAEKVLHNLTTNAVKGMSEGDQVETFVTDLRGKTLGQVYAIRTSKGFRLVGSPGQSEAILAHVDRYTIREDATGINRDQDYVPFVLPPQCDPAALAPIAFDCEVGWIGEASRLLLTDNEQDFLASVQSAEWSLMNFNEFHRQRTRAGFPWHGVDFDDSNLPQETGRDVAISFTKGCYLGQETIARLDALGQVQKKLVRWSIDSTDVEPGQKLMSGDKLVGRITSVAPLDLPIPGMELDDKAKSIAIGMARRSHFDPGSKAAGDGLEAAVLGPLVL